MAKAGIMTGMQPAFIPAFIGREKMELYETILGRGRLSWIHPYRTILNHGIPIYGVSDSPVTPYDRLACIQAAASHERVSFYEALEMFTATATWRAFEENGKERLRRASWPN
jgi:predicted amidohydrolase YtcJ